MSKRGVTGWVLYWKLGPGSALPVAAEMEVVAVLPGRWGEDRVSDVLQRLHLERTASPSELLTWQVGKRDPYKPVRPFSLHGVPVSGAGLLCGHNPELIARHVTGLRAVDQDTLEWIETAPRHPGWLCQERGVPYCALADKEPASRVVRSTAPDSADQQ